MDTALTTMQFALDAPAVFHAAPCSPLRVLVACEYSGAVRDAFIALGHDAISCDLLATDSTGPHYCGDVRDLMDYPFDLLIAHPPCTHLSVSGAKHFKDKRMDGRQHSAVSFFLMLSKSSIPRHRYRKSGLHYVIYVAQAGSGDSAVAIRTWRDKGNVPMAEGTSKASPN